MPGEAPGSHGSHLGPVDRSGASWLPGAQMEWSQASVEGLDQVVALGGRSEIREGDGERDGWAVMHPMRCDRGYVSPPPRREGAGRQFRRQGLDAPVRAIPVPLNLVPAGPLARQAAKTDRLGPTDLHQPPG